MATQVNHRSIEKKTVNLSSLNLFGRVEVVRETTQVPKNLSVSSVPLTLKGVFWVANEANEARAMISSKSGNGDEKLYQVDSKLPGGVEVVEIRRNEVVIRRNGNLETLKLPEEKSTDSKVTPLRALTPVKMDFDRPGPVRPGILPHR